MHYPHNGDNIAVRAADAGKSDRTDLWNVDVVGNFLNDEVIIGCELPDEMVRCANNSP